MFYLGGLLILIQAHCLICAGARGADSWSVLGGTRLKEVTVPIYLNRNPVAAGAIRVQHLFGGHQRRGFFRIGSLPAAIAETVKFEVTNEKEAREVLSGMDSYLRQVSDGKLWELRAISLHVAEACSLVLRLEGWSWRRTESGGSIDALFSMVMGNPPIPRRPFLTYEVVTDCCAGTREEQKRQ